MIRKKALQALLVVAGTVSLIVGIIGIFVPLLPTTPFVLLASACYVRSSERMHRWLLSSPWLGEYIRNFEEGRGITPRGKAVVLVVLWASMAYSIYRLETLAIEIGLVVIGICVTLWILRMPTMRVKA